jgi:hypothetical protein
MKISFTLSQLENYALSESRFQTFYDMARLHAGIPVGEPWFEYDCMRYVELKLKHFNSTTEYEEGQSVLICGEAFNLEMHRHAYKVRIARQHLQTCLNKLHAGEIHILFVRQARKEFVDLLNEVEL